MSTDTHLDAAVVVLSSDGYGDFWPIFFEFFEKHSGLTALPLYLLAEQKTHEHPRLKTINYPHLINAPWSTRIAFGLRAIEHTHVIIFTEDLLCTIPCSFADWQQLARFSLVKDATCIRMAPVPPPHPRNLGTFSTLCAHALHRVSLQPSLWKRARLLELLIDGETPWEFEVNGSRRSRPDPAFFCSNEPLLHYQEVIGRGRVTRKGGRLIRSAGLGSHLTRPLYSRFDEIERNLSHLKARMFYAIPPAIQDLLIRKGLVGRAFHD